MIQRRGGAGLAPDMGALFPGPHQAVLKETLRALFASRTRAEWEAFAREHDCCLEPVLEPEELRGGVVYYDGQFDDARLLIHLAMTAAEHGATVVNYCPATSLLRDSEGYINGLTARDSETGEEFALNARIVVNATGVFTDSIRRMADPSADQLVVTSQGIHLVFDRSFLKSDTALMVPRTSDGRVLFVIPWHGHAVAGTTDTPLDAPCLEPRPLDEEIEFILETARHYLTRPPTRADVLSVYVGLRPLVKGDGKTSALSRDHVIHVDPTGLLTITGGKFELFGVVP